MTEPVVPDCPWPTAPLGEIAPIVRRPVATEIDRTYPIIAARSFGRGTFHQPSLAGAEITWERLFQVRAGDLLVSNIKAWEGAVGIVAECDDGMYCSHRYLTCVADRQRVLPDWLGLYFRTPSAIRQLAAASPGSADRNRTLGMDGLRAVRVPVPSLEEQRRIVAHIGVLSAKLVEARKLRMESDEAGTRLLAAMAHRNDLSDNQRKSQGWRDVRLGDVLTEYSDPHSVQAGTEYPNFGILSFGRGLFGKPPINGLESSATRLFRAKGGLFIYSRLFAFEGAYGVVDDEYDGSFVSNEYPMFTCKADEIIPEFLAAYVLSQAVWKKFAVGSIGLGDRRQRVQPSQLLTQTVTVPPMSWQLRIADTRQGLKASVPLRAEIAAELDALFPAILDKAFRGEL